MEIHQRSYSEDRQSRMAATDDEDASLEAVLVDRACNRTQVAYEGLPYGRVGPDCGYSYNRGRSATGAYLGEDNSRREGNHKLVPDGHDDVAS